MHFLFQLNNICNVKIKMAYTEILTRILKQIYMCTEIEKKINTISPYQYLEIFSMAWP